MKEKIAVVGIIFLLAIGGNAVLLNALAPRSPPIPAAKGDGNDNLTDGPANSPWPMFHHNLNHTGLSPYDTSLNPGDLRWSFTTGGLVPESPAIGFDGTIYIGSHDNNLYAINPNGTLKWNFTSGDWIDSSPAISSDGTIYVGSLDNNLHAINPDGTLKWNFATGSSVTSSPTIGSDGTIYFGSQDYRLYAVYPNGTQKWNFTTGYLVVSVPAIGANGTIYVGSNDYKLYAINPDGTQKWNFTTGNIVGSSPAIGTDGTIYVGSDDHKLYAINPDSTHKWNFTTGEDIHSSPAIGSNDTIYVSSYDHKLYAINPDGTQKWNFTTGHVMPSSPAIGSDGTIFVGSFDGRLYAIYPNGTERWNFPTGNRVGSSPAIGSDGTIYVGSHDQNLYAIGFPIGTPGLEVTITANPLTINSGGQAGITVHVTDGTNPVQDATVSLTSNNGGTFSPQSGTTDINGDFTSIFNAPTVTTQTICRIFSQAIKAGYNSGYGHVDVTVNPIPWPMFRHNLRHTGLSPYDTSANPGKLKWCFMADGYIEASPTIGSDGTIYVGSNDKNLYAINPNGTEKWNFTTGHYVWSTPAIGSDGTIYVGSLTNNLHAINPDGTEKWNFTTGRSVDSSPAIGFDGTIYVGSDDSKLYAINPDGTEKWNFTTGDEVFSSPAIGSDGTIYVGSRDGKLYAINPNGTEKWNFTAGNEVDSSPAIASDGTIYVGSYDYKLWAINPNGTEKWSFTTGDQIESSPAIGSDSTIYVGSWDNKLYAINPDSTEKWNFTTGSRVHSSPAIGSDGTIYVGSVDNKLYAINPDGTEKWSFMTGDFVYHVSPAIGSDGTIYIGSRDCKLYAIGTPQNTVVTVAANPLTVNSTGQSAITVQITNGTAPVTGAFVNLSSNNGGTFTPQSGLTDGNGNFTSTFTAPIVTIQTICRITANATKIGYNDGSGYVDVTINPILLEVTVNANPTTVNSSQTSTTTVHVTDGTNPVQGASINLTSDNSGSFSPQNGTTDGNGNFTSTFTAPIVTIQTICRIAANATKMGYNNGSGYVDVTVNPILLNVTVSANPTTINSTQTSTITVHVTDGTNPAQDATVSLTSNNGGTFIPQSGTTDGNGNFTSTFTAPIVTIQTICRITANATKMGYNNGSGYVEVTVIPLLTVTVNANPTTMYSGQTSTVTVHVTDGTNPVQGVTVSLTSNNGGTFSPQSGSTDSNGDFSSTFTAPSVTIQTICRITANATKMGYNPASGYVDVTVNMVSAPITSIVIGQPNYTTTLTCINSSTPLAFSVIDQTGAGIRCTMYRIDNGTSVNYTATGPFTVLSEGAHTIYYNSTNNLGVTEDTKTFDIIVDNTPPGTTIAVGEPKYKGDLSDIWNVTSAATFILSAIDGGVGLNYTEYRIWGNGSWSDWYKYTDVFNLGSENGTRYIEFYGVDYVGNKETTHNETYFVDNIPPITTYILEHDDTEARISLIANDVGSGVNFTQYRVGLGNWTTYSSTFAINEPGWHTIYFLSVDKLGNVEHEKNFSVLIERPGAIIPPSDDEEKETNYKSLIALVFSIILLLVGSYVSYKRPLSLKEEIVKNKLLTWLIAVLPFVVAESLTGAISALTGALSVPPLFGVGMIVDLAILIAGLATFTIVFMRKRRV